MTDEPKEISILIRNLRLIKRIFLGKQNPPLFLKVVSIVSAIWSFVNISVISGLLFLLIMSPDVDVLNDLNAIDQKFFVSYIGLHFIALFGIMLMWRRNLMGFYIFTFINLLMPFWLSFFLPVFTFNVYWLIPTIGFIVLFGLNWTVFKNKKGEEIKKQVNEEVDE